MMELFFVRNSFCGIILHFYYFRKEAYYSSNLCKRGKINIIIVIKQ
jgi:hypothetical protein